MRLRQTHVRRWALAALLATTATSAVADSPGTPRETITPTFQHAIPNIPGKSLVTVVVDYPPGGKSGPHRHAASAFVYAYVLSGAVRSQVDDGPDSVYHAGESFFEAPGAHHRISENASTAEAARLLAVFVVDTDDRALTVHDSH